MCVCVCVRVRVCISMYHKSYSMSYLLIASVIAF